MENLIIIAVLLIVVGAAVFYIRKEKKKGTRCIGCPHAGCCSRKECAGEKNNIKKHL
ncbi:MAG: FeoB-associated Cys-rich membrane protein [Lachnospiraceae bacterium]